METLELDCCDIVEAAGDQDKASSALHSSMPVVPFLRALLSHFHSPERDHCCSCKLGPIVIHRDTRKAQVPFLHDYHCSSRRRGGPEWARWTGSTAVVDQESLPGEPGTRRVACAH